MSTKKLINIVMEDNIKNNPNEVYKTDIVNDSNNKDNDNSFNQLLSLQLLIKKHSGLKELCK